MTPQSVGVPDSTLVLGKHSGRHALAIRCEQLGHQFDRRELDDLYKRFVTLADRIKQVRDHHLLELIGSVKAQTQNANFDGKARAAVASAGSDAKREQAIPGLPRTDFPPILFPSSEHHGEQEDYLWGV